MLSSCAFVILYIHCRVRTPDSFVALSHRTSCWKFFKMGDSLIMRMYDFDHFPCMWSIH